MKASLKANIFENYWPDSETQRANTRRKKSESPDLDNVIVCLPPLRYNPIIFQLDWEDKNLSRLDSDQGK